MTKISMSIQKNQLLFNYFKLFLNNILLKDQLIYNIKYMLNYFTNFY